MKDAVHGKSAKLVPEGDPVVQSLTFGRFYADVNLSFQLFRGIAQVEGDDVRWSVPAEELPV